MRFVKWAWTLILCLSVLLVIFRFGLALITPEPLKAVAYIVGITVPLYILFMLEGLHVAAIQIRTADPDGLQEYVRQNLAGRRQAKVLSITALFRNHLPDFMIGRQIFTMLAIVWIAFAFDALPMNETSSFFTWVDQHWPGSGEAIFDGLGLFGIVFIMATLLPCWVGQLWPQFLAEGRGVEFSQLPGAKWVTFLSLGIAKVGAGWPGELFFRGIQRTGYFTGEERIGIGEAAIHERLVASHGSSIEERIIEINAEADNLQIIDRNRIAFTAEGTSEIRHMVRLRTDREQADINVVGWQFRFPEGIEHDAHHAKTLELSIREVAASQEVQGARPAYHPIGNELVFSFETALQVSIPRANQRSEEVELSLALRTNGLVWDQGVQDAFYFAIMRPTKKLIFNLRCAPQYFIRQPELTFEPADQGLVIGEAQAVRKEGVRIDRTSNGWRVEADYPPLGTRALLTLDGRRKAETAT